MKRSMGVLLGILMVVMLFASSVNAEVLLADSGDYMDDGTHGLALSAPFKLTGSGTYQISSITVKNFRMYCGAHIGTPDTHAVNIRIFKTKPQPNTTATAMPDDTPQGLIAVSSNDVVLNYNASCSNPDPYVTFNFTFSPSVTLDYGTWYTVVLRKKNITDHAHRIEMRWGISTNLNQFKESGGCSYEETECGAAMSTRTDIWAIMLNNTFGFQIYGPNPPPPPPPALKMPFPSGTSPHYCIQGKDGTFSHQANNTKYDLDLDTPNDSDEDVVAAASGTAYTHPDAGPNSFGNHITVDHGNGYFTLYAHLKSFSVTNGQSVSQGQVIGKEGCTGYCQGDHLHFGLHTGDPTLDALNSASVLAEKITTKDVTAGGSFVEITSDEFVCEDPDGTGHFYESNNTAP